MKTLVRKPGTPTAGWRERCASAPPAMFAALEAENRAMLELAAYHHVPAGALEHLDRLGLASVRAAREHGYKVAFRKV